MTIDEETLLRETFLRAEADAPAGGDLGRRATGTARRRRRRLVAGISAAAALVAAGVVTSVLRAAEPASIDATAAPTPTAAAGPLGVTRYVSAYGIEFDVPAHWRTNDYGCGMTDGPTVVAALGVAQLCAFGEPSTKDVVVVHPHARFFPDEYAAGLRSVRFSWTDVVIDGARGSQAVARHPDGRTAAVLLLPDQNVSMGLRVRSPAQLQAVLASVRVVRGVDRNGCLREAAVVPSQAFGPPATVDVSNVERISVCYLNAGRLALSQRLDGRLSADLVAALRAAPAGRTPDLPRCSQPQPGRFFVLLLRTTGRPDRRLVVQYEGCRNRGVVHPGGVARDTESVVQLLLHGTHVSGPASYLRRAR